MRKQDIESVMMNDHYYKIYGWMKNVYKLRGNSLEVYAALYALTKKKSWTGTYETLAGYIDIELKTLRRTTKILVEKGLLSFEKIAYNTYAFQAVHGAGCTVHDAQCTMHDAQCTVHDEQLEGQNVPTQGQNVPTQGQNVPTLKERTKENINNILNKRENNVCVAKPHTDAPSGTHTESFEKDYFIAPQWEEIYRYAQEKMISIEVAKNFFAHYSTTGWKLGRGGKIYDWHALLYKFDVKAREIAKEQAVRAVTHYQQGNQLTSEQVAARKRQLESERLSREQSDIAFDAEKNDAETQEEIANIQERLAKKLRVK